MSLQCVEISVINNPKLLASVIYKNFEHLAQYPELGHNPPAIEKLLLNAEGINFLIYHENRIIAYMIGDKRYLDDHRYVYYISYLYVVEKHRNKKLGSHLIERAIKKCRDIGISFILLSCYRRNERGNRFYLKHGFNLDPILGRTNPSQNIFCLYL